MSLCSLFQQSFSKPAGLTAHYKQSQIGLQYSSLLESTCLSFRIFILIIYLLHFYMGYMSVTGGCCGEKDLMDGTEHMEWCQKAGNVFNVFVTIPKITQSFTIISLFIYFKFLEDTNIFVFLRTHFTYTFYIHGTFKYSNHITYIFTFLIV